MKMNLRKKLAKAALPRIVAVPVLLLLTLTLVASPYPATTTLAGPAPRSASVTAAQTAKLDQYLEIEFQRIAETYNLMETYAREIWPGWDNWLEIQFGVQFPNLVFLIVNPIEDVPQGYVKLEGRTVHGKDIYLNRTEELPIKLEPPLSGGGGGGYKISIMLNERPKPEPSAPAKGPDGKTQALAKPSDEEIHSVASERQILLYVHEYFHGYQQKVLPWMKRPAPPKPKPGEAAVKPKPTPRRPARPKNWRPPQFQPNVDYSTYKEIAGAALAKAYAEKNDKIARDYIKDYVVARERQLASMPKEFSDDERRTQVAEGTATYSNTKMAMLARQAGYHPVMSAKDDPYFYGYRFLDSYLSQQMEESIKHCMESTLDTLGHSYTYGCYQCFLLDRLLPGWKDGFFEKEKTMDAVMEGLVALTEADKKAVTDGYEARYGFAKVRARHAEVIKNRDDAIATVENRKGRKFIVDFEATREFFNTKARGKEVVLGVRQIFLNGLESLTIGDVTMTSIDTPLERDWLWTVQWVDTEAKPGDKAYEITYESKEPEQVAAKDVVPADAKDGAKPGAAAAAKPAEILKNVTIKTKGFTLKAPEVKLTEEENNTLRIEILSKVARKRPS